MYTGSRGGGLGPEVKRRILMGTYALSAGYYDAYYKRAQQVRVCGGGGDWCGIARLVLAGCYKCAQQACVGSSAGAPGSNMVRGATHPCACGRGPQGLLRRNVCWAAARICPHACAVARRAGLRSAANDVMRRPPSPRCAPAMAGAHAGEERDGVGARAL